MFVCLVVFICCGLIVSVCGILIVYAFYDLVRHNYTHYTKQPTKVLLFFDLSKEIVNCLHFVARFGYF